MPCSWGATLLVAARARAGCTDGSERERTRQRQRCSWRGCPIWLVALVAAAAAANGAARKAAAMPCAGRCSPQSWHACMCRPIHQASPHPSAAPRPLRTAAARQCRGRLCCSLPRGDLHPVQVECGVEGLRRHAAAAWAGARDRRLGAAGALVLDDDAGRLGGPGTYLRIVWSARWDGCTWAARARVALARWQRSGHEAGRAGTLPWRTQHAATP